MDEHGAKRLLPCCKAATPTKIGMKSLVEATDGDKRLLPCCKAATPTKIAMKSLVEATDGVSGSGEQLCVVGWL